MSNFLQFLQMCGDKSIQFSLHDQQVKVHAPKDTLSPEIIAQLRLFKPELLKWLKENENKKTSEISAEKSLRAFEWFLTAIIYVQTF